MARCPYCSVFEGDNHHSLCPALQRKRDPAMHRHNGTDYQHANDCPHCWREASDIQSAAIDRLSAQLAEKSDTIERLQRERAASDADCAEYMNKAHEHAERIKVLERHCDELTRRAEKAERALSEEMAFVESLRSQRNDMKRERDEARAAIREAPHNMGCYSLQAEFQHTAGWASLEYCDCWKRAALGGEG